MKKIRRLYLQNAAGDQLSLNGENGVYVSNLAGFGFSLDPDFADLSHGFFISLNEESEPQNSLSFTLTFTRTPYVYYLNFVNWISSAGRITLVYDPTGYQPYCREISIQSLQKGELTVVGWLEVPCSCICNTPWYLPTPSTLVLEGNGIGECKRYDYEYDDRLLYGLDSSAALSGSIRASGHVPGAVEIYVHGAIVNPKIRLVGDTTGKTYGICSVAVSLGESDMLKYSSRYENSYVKKVSADGVETDLLDELDLGTSPFFHIPVDESCTISIEADNQFDGQADMTIYYYFRSV